MKVNASCLGCGFNKPLEKKDAFKKIGECPLCGFTEWDISWII